MAIIMGSLAEGLIPALLGLAVAAFASGLFKYLTNRLAIIDIEMKTASLNLANALTHIAYHS